MSRIAAPRACSPKTLGNRLYGSISTLLGISIAVARVKRIPAESVDPTVNNDHWLDIGAGLFEAFDRGAENVVLTGLCLANSYYVYKSPLFHRLVNPGGNGTIWVHA